jgi:hypothetical protein
VGAALVVNLWVGGALLYEFVGRYARTGFELALILAYLHFVWGYPGRLRPPAEDEPRDRGEPRP